MFDPVEVRVYVWKLFRDLHWRSVYQRERQEAILFSIKQRQRLEKLAGQRKTWPFRYRKIVAAPGGRERAREKWRRWRERTRQDAEANRKYLNRKAEREMRNKKPAEIRRWKPGQKCPISGQYAVYQQSAKGARYKYAHQITMTEGEVFPPHGEGSVRYVLTDRTRHEGEQS